MKIIFMGTPDFACEILEKIFLTKKTEVIAVYTREPKVAGRGKKLTNSPVHEFAIKKGIKVFTPRTLKSSEVQEEFRKLEADVAIVAAYGLILPKEILVAPKFGCINVHPSILPKWRGAAPIQRTIMAGDKETGVTIIQMSEGLDSGDILECLEFPLDEKILYSELAKKFASLGYEALVRSLEKIDKNQLRPIPQNHQEATYADKINKEECLIDWHASAQEIAQKIRGLSGCLEAYFIYREEKIKIFQCEIIDLLTSPEASGFCPGEVMNETFFIQCKRGIIRPTIIQKAGKNPIAIDDFLRGFRYAKLPKT